MRRIRLFEALSSRALPFGTQLFGSRRRGHSHAMALAGLLLAGATVLTACSSSPAHPTAAPSAATAGTPEASGSPAPGASMSGMTMSAPPDAASQAPVAGNAVTVKNFAFSPSALTVKVGTTVTWTNQDSDAHTVTSRGTHDPLNSAPLNTGQTYSYTFTTPGTYAYMCTIHPFMTGTVTVTP